MHEKEFANQLHSEQLIDDEQLKSIVDFENSKPFSIHHEVKSLLYAGVSVLTTGLGILIYNNIDSIGHNVILAFIITITAGCFTYCSWYKEEFEWTQTESPNLWYDYVLLLGALTFLTLVGYLQYQYNLFGARWGLATFIPFVVITFAAYFYDHLGLLSMAIVLFASWLGITVTPTDLFSKNDFSSERFIYTGLALAIFLTLISLATKKYNRKEHFAFTYFNFAFNIGFIAALAGLFTLKMDWLWYIIIAGITSYCYRYALAEKSFYVLVLTFAYCYLALSNLVLNTISSFGLLTDNKLYLNLIYFIFSGIMVIKYLRMFKHKFHDDSIQHH